ncbi:MAG: DUF5067 domain-containing protein [Butyrivibrio sp.]|nr:DUF5067 domain-containing protein [Butyrivibrio sp.]
MLVLTACGNSTPKHILEITNQEFATVHDDYKVVCIYTTYTNNSGETAMPADWKDVMAFQNGVELSPIVFTGEEYNGYIPCDTNVQDGTTANVVWMFQVNDESEVTVEVKDL